MSVKWVLDLAFDYTRPGDGGWFDNQPITKTFSFASEDEAKAMFNEALQIVYDDPSKEGSGEEPSPAMYEFARKHGVVVYNDFGEMCGGFFQGEQVGDIVLALGSITSVAEIEDLTADWREDWEWAQ